MLEQANTKERVSLELIGEFQQFAEQLGSAPGIGNFTAAPSGWRLGRVDSLPVLRQFLEHYCARILVACELPTIFQAYEHAHRSELRELIAADLKVGRDALFQEFAGASQYVGTTQLKRLRPLRDQRLVQRYLGAVEKGEAYGWHSIVYGLILAVYSLPLRQGLVGYGEQTVHGFIKCAKFALELPEEQSRQLHQEVCARLPQAVDALVKNCSPQNLPAC